MNYPFFLKGSSHFLEDHCQLAALEEQVISINCLLIICRHWKVQSNWTTGENKTILNSWKYYEIRHQNRERVFVSVMRKRLGIFLIIGHPRNNRGKMWNWLNSICSAALRTIIGDFHLVKWLSQYCEMDLSLLELFPFAGLTQCFTKISPGSLLRVKI